MITQDRFGAALRSGRFARRWGVLISFVLAAVPLEGCSDDPAEQTEPTQTREPTTDRTFSAPERQSSATADAPGGTAGSGDPQRRYGLSQPYAGPVCVRCPTRFPQ